MFNPIENDKHLAILIGSALLLLAIAAGLVAASFKAFLYVVIVLPVGMASSYISYKYFTKNNTEETDFIDFTFFWFTGQSAPMAASVIAAGLAMTLTAVFLQKYLF